MLRALFSKRIPECLEYVSSYAGMNQYKRPFWILVSKRQEWKSSSKRHYIQVWALRPDGRQDYAVFSGSVANIAEWISTDWHTDVRMTELTIPEWNELRRLPV